MTDYSRTISSYIDLLPVKEAILNSLTISWKRLNERFHEVEYAIYTRMQDSHYTVEETIKAFLNEKDKIEDTIGGIHFRINEAMKARLNDISYMLSDECEEKSLHKIVRSSSMFDKMYEDNRVEITRATAARDTLESVANSLFA